MKRKELTNRLQDWQKRASETAKTVSQSTDKYVRENTWSTLALAAIIGCVVGYCLTCDRD